LSKLITRSPMLDWALWYTQELGRPIIPLRARGKEPLTRHGVHDATTDSLRVHHWWGQWPRANIGLACGWGLLVIDIDGLRGAKSWAPLARKLWPNDRCIGVESSTGSGRHLFLGYSAEKYPKLKPTAHKLGEGIDTRADDSYVVAPPSIHPNGKRYRWTYPPGDWPLVRAPTRVPRSLPLPPNLHAVRSLRIVAHRVRTSTLH
jgi:hypothetical protein